MDYLTASSQIENADVLAFHGKQFFSRIIQFRTLSRVSHVGLTYWLENRLCVLEAVGTGIRLYPIDRYLEAGCEIHWHQLLAKEYKVNRQIVIEEALRHWGAPYAKWYQFIRSWGIVSRRLFKRWNTPTDVDPEGMFCSELVGHSLVRGGYNEANGHIIVPAKTSPGDVVSWPCLHHKGQLVK